MTEIWTQTPDTPTYAQKRAKLDVGHFYFYTREGISSHQISAIGLL